MFQEMFIILW